MISSGAVIATVVTWVVLMILTAPKGTVEQQLERLGKSSVLYRWTFVNASLIAPLMVTLLLVLQRIPQRPAGLLDSVGTAFIIAYLSLITPTYASQYTVFPALLRKGSELRTLLYFGNTGSFPHFIALLAYGLFGIGAIVFAFPLTSSGGIWTSVGWVLFASGITSVLGFIGFSMGNRFVQFLNVVGGILVVPFAVLVLAGSA